MAYDDLYRLSTAQVLAVASTGGAAASSARFGAQTYALQLCYPGSVSSTGGLRIVVGDAPTADSTSALLPPSWLAQVRCSPGQRVSVISNDAGTANLSIVELTK
jgi:hypothetical protein